MRALAGLAAMLLPACGGPDGRAPEPGARPTIVSLNPCADTILAEVADPEQLLAISHYNHDPRAASMDLATARRFRSTGGTVEEVLALDPDVVVASSFLAPATRTALEDLGIAVVTLGMAMTVEDSIEQVHQLARLAGDRAAGERLAADIAEVAEPRGGPHLAAVLWQPGGIVPGEAALVSDLMRRSGLSSHSAARGLGQADYLALEQILADPPELLLITGRERGQRHPLLEQVEGMHLVRYDQRLLFCGGPVIIRAMERLREVREAIARRGGEAA